MRTLLLLLLPALAWAQPESFDHSAWDRVLKRIVNAIGEVDYAALKRDRAELDAYLAALARSSPDNRPELFPSKRDELAYWMNAYNALVTGAVAAQYPTKSVRDLGFLYGFFRRKEHTLGGRTMSLMSLEHDIIRRRYGDARIHFAIVCASLSCPRLAPEVFVGRTVDAQLDGLARQFLTERRGMSIDERANTIWLSALFKWYDDDFGDVLAFLKKYAGGEDRKRLDAMRSPRLRHYEYDWSINDPGSRARAKSEWERALASR